MEFVKSYFVSNIIMLVIGAVMVFLAVYNIKSHRRISICIISITAIAVFLSIAEALELYFKSVASIPGATIMAFLQYVTRPACVIVFIFLSKREPKGKWLIPFLAPFVINFVIFLLSLFPGTRELVFYFISGESGGIAFQAGPLRFSSHIVAALYLIYFLFVSIWSLKLKHFSNAIIILVCVFMIVACVVVETFFDNDSEIDILNTGIMVCVMSYYLFLFIESMRYDPLTGLFNRATYYQDFLRMEASATAIIQFDMNGLKYLNDNFGHEEGDKALKEIARIVATRCPQNLYAYRLGGDEYIVIANNASEDSVKAAIEKMKLDLSKTKYTCAIGFAYRHDKKVTLNELVKQAEAEMYAAKSEFYKTSKIERRKA